VSDPADVARGCPPSEAVTILMKARRSKATAGVGERNPLIDRSDVARAKVRSLRRGKAPAQVALLGWRT